MAHLMRIAFDAWWDERRGGVALASRQTKRLRRLVRFARQSSPYYRELYKGLPPDAADPLLLPPVTKRDLMSRFDEWVTDPEVTLAALERDLLPDLSLVGHRYLGRYRVVTTSGTTGEPAVLVHDPQSWAVLNVVSRLRARHVVTRQEVGRLIREGWRTAELFATGGHFGGVVLAESVRRRSRWFADHVRVVSVLRPVADIVAELNDFRPTVLGGYPSAVALMAAEQRAGRLRISPIMAVTAGENLTPAMREQIRRHLGCRVVQGYAASEVPALAIECRNGLFHVNSDWYLLEPVDERYRPVPPGVTSHTVLVTNLANYVQPIIRYDLGDRVRLSEALCACGSPLPAVSVEGRTGDALTFEAADGHQVTVLPIALGTVIEEVVGVHRFQAIGTGPRSLTIRLETDEGADPARVREAVDTALGKFLAKHGLSSVSVRHDDQPLQTGPRSGKLRQVWSE